MKSEREWQAEEDARILIRAEELQNDNSRLQNAKVALKKMLDEKEDETKIIKKLASPQKSRNVDSPKIRTQSQSSNRTQSNTPSWWSK